jgi:hypothetical protein
MPEQINSNLNPNACPKEVAPPAEIAARRHGLLASRTLLQYEDAEGFHSLMAQLMASWCPANAQEQLLVEQITQAAWRMQRITRVETGLFDLMLRNLCAEVGVKQNPHGDEGIAIIVQTDKLSLDVLRRYMAEAHRQYNTLIRQLRDLQKLRNSMTPKPPMDRVRKPQVYKKERAIAAGSMPSANNIHPMPKTAASAAPASLRNASQRSAPIPINRGKATGIRSSQAATARPRADAISEPQGRSSQLGLTG